MDRAKRASASLPKLTEGVSAYSGDDLVYIIELSNYSVVILATTDNHSINVEDDLR